MDLQARDHDLVTVGRHPAGGFVNQPRQGFAAVVQGQVHAENVAQVVEIDLRIHFQGALVDPFEETFLFVELVFDLADDLLEHVLEGDQTCGAAVLVDHHGHMDALGAELLEHLVETLALGDVVGRPRKLRDAALIKVAVGQHAQEVFGVQQSGDLVHRSVMNRYPRVLALTDHINRRGQRRGCIEGDHIDARHHDFTDRYFVEAEDALDHLPFFDLEIDFVVFLMQQAADLTIGKMRHGFRDPVGIVTRALTPRQQRRPGREQPMERQQQASEGPHDVEGVPRSEPFGSSASPGPGHHDQNGHADVNTQRCRVRPDDLRHPGQGQAGDDRHREVPGADCHDEAPRRHQNAGHGARHGVVLDQAMTLQTAGAEHGGQQSEQGHGRPEGRQSDQRIQAEAHRKIGVHLSHVLHSEADAAARRQPGVPVRGRACRAPRPRLGDPNPAHAAGRAPSTWRFRRRDPSPVSNSAHE